MNRRQKLVQAQFLNNEEAVIRRLKSIYNASQKDIEKKAQALQDDINRLGTLAKLSVDDEEKEKLLSMQQSKIYQKQYQDALKKQIGSVLDNMQVEEFKTVSEYLQKCYEDGFVGTMFDLQGQGIPLCFPLDQEAMVRAVQLDSKISNGLYSRLGEDVSMLKRKISAEVSRGIATGMPFQQVAKQLAGISNIGYNNAVRIARTEGHRIQVQSAMDACHKAKDKGADVVKQWDSTLDGATRESHQAVDGEIRELDKPFSNGLMFPGDPSGGAAEVVNCRCALLQRARWALGEDELQTLKDRAEYFGLDKAKTFEDYKKTYLKAAVPARFDWGTIPKESRMSYEKAFNMLSERYPLKNEPVTWVGDFRIPNGYDLEEDFIDLTDRETQWFGVGARFMPSSKFSSVPYIEIVDPEIRVGTAEDYLGELAKIRAKNGWHGRQNSFFNMVGNTETALIHEYGHAVANDCGLYGSAESAMQLWELFESTPKEEIERQLSIYASSSPDEMLAEAFTQSFAPEELQSELCKTIMKMIADARGSG